MWVPYRDAARACLPQAQIIVDKFHVVRMANLALEEVRKTVRASLTDRQRRALMHDRYVLLRRRHDLDVRGQLLLAACLRYGSGYPSHLQKLQKHRTHRTANCYDPPEDSFKKCYCVIDPCHPNRFLVGVQFL